MEPKKIVKALELDDLDDLEDSDLELLRETGYDRERTEVGRKKEEAAGVEDIVESALVGDKEAKEQAKILFYTWGLDEKRGDDDDEDEGGSYGRDPDREDFHADNRTFSDERWGWD